MIPSEHLRIVLFFGAFHCSLTFALMRFPEPPIHGFWLVLTRTYLNSFEKPTLSRKFPHTACDWIYQALGFFAGSLSSFAESAGVHTCPCDRCCATLVLEADEDYDLHNDDLFDVQQHPQTRLWPSLYSFSVNLASTLRVPFPKMACFHIEPFVALQFIAKSQPGIIYLVWEIMVAKCFPLMKLRFYWFSSWRNQHSLLCICICFNDVYCFDTHPINLTFRVLFVIIRLVVPTSFSKICGFEHFFLQMILDFNVLVFQFVCLTFSASGCNYGTLLANFKCGAMCPILPESAKLSLNSFGLFTCGETFHTLFCVKDLLNFRYLGPEVSTAKGAGVDTCPSDRCCATPVFEASEAHDLRKNASFTLRVQFIIHCEPYTTAANFCSERLVQLISLNMVCTLQFVSFMTFIVPVCNHGIQFAQKSIDCLISKCLSNFGWQHLTPASPRFLVQNAGFGAFFVDFLGSNFWIPFVTEAGLKFGTIDTDALFHPMCTGFSSCSRRSLFTATRTLASSTALHLTPVEDHTNDLATCIDLFMKNPCSNLRSFQGAYHTQVLSFLIVALTLIVESKRESDNINHIAFPCMLTTENYVEAILAYQFHQDSVIVACIRPKHHHPTFDATMGYPGEGPNQWTCITANVESLATHPHYILWQHDVQFLQEIRVAESNYNDIKFKLAPSKRILHCSKLLDLKQQKNAVYRIPHGGTGIIGPQPVLQPFCATHDITGKWNNIACTTRVSGAWIQVLPKLKVLTFSFYGFTNHTDREEEIYEMNNQLLSDLFEITVQYGDIPIIIGGDFQKEPETYEAFQQAKQSNGWFDPLAKIDDQGNVTRPYTFSRSNNFVNPTDNATSIDALLLNPCAAAALESIEILTGDARQHAPIRASFQWPKVFQKGHVHIKPAPLNFSELKCVDGKPDVLHIESVAKSLWEHTFEEKCSQRNNEDAWQAINQYGIEILLNCGAKFGKGPKTRGTKPQFREKIICPGQNCDGDAKVQASAGLSKTHSLIAELIHRLNRTAKKLADMEITHKLQCKVCKKLKNNPLFPGWNEDNHLNIGTLGIIQKILQKEICTLRNKEKYDRVQKWRDSMKVGTASKNVDKKVFQWVRQKQAKQSANLIVGQDGHVIYNPLEAINEINNQWDGIYSVNTLHDDPMNILACVWPHIQKYRNPIVLKPLCGKDLMQQVTSRRPNAAPGLDGWRTIECQLLPTSFYDAVAVFFNEVENGRRDMPKTLLAAKQVILDKPHAQDTPLQKRVLTILPVMLLAYTGLRFKQLQKWQQETLPLEIHGGIKGRKMTDAHSMIRLEMDHAKTTGCHILGVKLDKSKCFDRLIPTVTAALFLAYGLPKGLTMFFSKMYLGLHRYMNYKEWSSPIPTTSSNGLAQGCSLSLLAINVHMAVWHAFIQHLPVLSATFIDDCYLWASITNAACVEKAIELTKLWDELCGQKLNMSKCQVWSTNAAGRKILKDILPNMKLVYLVEKLFSGLLKKPTKFAMT